jgi:colanic acid/amylovoran biosynthesis glycosyltransferase
MRRAVLHFTRRVGTASATFVPNAINPGAGPNDAVACLRIVDRDHRLALPVHVVEVPNDRINRRYPKTHGPRRALKTAAAGVRHGAGLIHAHFAYDVEVPLLAGQYARVPVVVSAWGQDVLVERSPENIAATLNRAAAVLVPSRYLRDALAGHGVDAHRLRIVAAGIDLARHAPGGPPVDERDGVGFIGRFVEKKGVLDLVDALHTLAGGSARPFVGRFAGYGPLEDDLRARAAAGPAHIEILDGRDDANVEAVYSSAAVVVTPSRTAANGDAETLCYVNVEAQARGIPVVTTRHGGIEDGISPASAAVVDEGDVPALAAAIGAVLADPARSRAMGAAGRALALKRFDRDRQAAAIRDVYRDVGLRGAPRQPRL